MTLNQGKRAYMMAMLTASSLFAVTNAHAQSPSLVQIESGTIQGVTNHDVMSFKGIPFAAPQSDHFAGKHRNQPQHSKVFDKPTNMVTIACKSPSPAMPHSSARNLPKIV